MLIHATPLRYVNKFYFEEESLGKEASNKYTILLHSLYTLNVSNLLEDPTMSSNARKGVASNIT